MNVLLRYKQTDNVSLEERISGAMALIDNNKEVREGLPMADFE